VAVESDADAMKQISQSDEELVGPIDNLKSGDCLKVSDIARHQCRSLSQCDTGDEQVGTTNFPNGLVLKQPIKLVCRIGVEGDNRYFGKSILSITQALFEQSAIAVRRQL
jgi:hypothetical protein